MADNDWVLEAFPGDGLEVPSDYERDRADRMLAECAARWGEKPITIPRTYPPGSGTLPQALVNQPTNRAYLRSRVRRWWAKALPD